MNVHPFDSLHHAGTIVTAFKVVSEPPRSYGYSIRLERVTAIVVGQPFGN